MSLSIFVIVSKDPDVQRLAQRYGQEVFGADDLADALDTVQTVDPDLILFDCRFSADHIGDYLDDFAKGLDDLMADCLTPAEEYLARDDRLRDQDLKVRREFGAVDPPYGGGGP